MTDPTLRKKQIDEAVSRMGAMGLGGLCIDDLRRGHIWESKPHSLFDITVGAAAPLNVGDTDIADASGWLMNIDIDALIYHAVTGVGEFVDGSRYRMVQLLFVSGSPLDWSYERPLCQNTKGPGSVFHIYSAVYNVTRPELSDLGLIAVRSCAGGLVRIA